MQTTWLASAVEGVRDGPYGVDTYALSATHGIVVALSAGQPHVLQLTGRSTQGVSKWALVDVVEDGADAVEAVFAYAIDRDNFVATDGTVLDRYSFDEASRTFVLTDASEFLDLSCVDPANMDMRDAAIAVVCQDPVVLNQTSSSHRRVFVAHDSSTTMAVKANEIDATPAWASATAIDLISVQKVAASNSTLFGAGLALGADGSTLVVGDPLTDDPDTDLELLSSYGQVTFFARTETTNGASSWNQVATLKAPDDPRCLRTVHQTLSNITSENLIAESASAFVVQNACAMFGHAVALSPDSNVLVVASRGLRRISGYVDATTGADVLLGQDLATEARSGSVHIYTRTGADDDSVEWVYQRSLFEDVSGLLRLELNFAESIAFDGTILAVSAPGYGSGSVDSQDAGTLPSLRIFNASQTWALTSRIESPLAKETSLDDYMGTDLAILPDGNIVATSFLAEVGVIFEPEPPAATETSLQDYLVFIGLGLGVLATAGVAIIMWVLRDRRRRRHAEITGVSPGIVGSATTPRVFIDV